jgi:hypothetical protein
MRGNLHKLTIGEWFYRTPGILKSMNVSIDNEYPWEIKYNEPETERKKDAEGKTIGFKRADFQKDGLLGFDYNGTYVSTWQANAAEGSPNFRTSNSDADMMELPQILSIQFSFIPIHNNLPRLAKESGKFTNTSVLISNAIGVDENFLNRI